MEVRGAQMSFALDDGVRFLAGEFSVSFEVWSGLIKVRRALFQSPKNIFPGSCSKTCISLQKECYFERIS
ncbi:hypothetical protein HDF09_001051 [Edaphobacter lichenicola]|uniref:Uncharacterized protein n=1 Tax=Tunturiibacter empetritectus TaxID=3069691 RepID=A0A7W8IHH4_9BACT|nr:hypothetical protein [Edaphobacter lichenicola]